MIKKYSKFLKTKNNELILVDNGSKDETNKVFKKLNKYKNISTCKVKKNIGFGYGLKKGIQKAQGKYLICSHADLEVDPKDITKSIDIFKIGRAHV